MVWQTVKISSERSIIHVCGGVKMIILWNGIRCRTKYCHSNNFQHPALTISHPQIPTTEGQALCLQSKWELWDCNPAWLKQELWHLTSVVLIRKLLRPFVAESCLQPGMTSVLTHFEWGLSLDGVSRTQPEGICSGICSWGSNTWGGRAVLSSATSEHSLWTRT